MLKKQYLKSKDFCKVTFTLPLEVAPDAKEVKVLGDFNDWSWQEGAPMKVVNASYIAEVELETGRRHEFRYLIDNQTWENDWDADDYAPTPFGVFNSVAEISEALDTPFMPEEIAEKAQAAAAEASDTKPKKATKKGGKKDADQDDLTKIEGIGPKIAGLLIERGILTFSALAQTEIAILKEVLDAAGSRFRMHDPSTWAEQAQLAADGNWEKLATLQVELKGGKR